VLPRINLSLPLIPSLKLGAPDLRLFGGHGSLRA
jgi:hypothetical protein